MPRFMNRSRRFLGLVILCTALTTAIVGCGRMSSQFRGQSEAASERAQAPPKSAADMEAPAGEDSTLPDVSQAAVSRKIIRTGDIDLEVEDVQQTMSRISEVTRKAGGYVGDSNVYESEGGLKRGSITVRVPADRFETLFEQFRTFGADGTAVSYRQSAEDVTEEWVDLEARIENKTKQEKSLQNHLEREAELSDILAVEQELYRVRGEIERLEGRMRYLKNQVSLSTITVNLDEIPQAGIGGSKAWRIGYHLRNAWQSLVDFVRWLVIAIIYVVIVGAPVYIPIILLVRWIVRRRRRREAEKVDAAAEE